MSERGKYIVIEGGDGTGKSTQAVALDATLELLGYDTLRVINGDNGRFEPVQEPGGTPRANELRRMIKDKSIEHTPWQDVLWFTEARQSIWNEAILPALESGKHVITARSYLSTLAYQGYGEGIPLDEIEAITRDMVGEEYMNPDFVAILAMFDEAERRQRMQGRGTDANLDTFESKPQEFQASMQDGFVQVAKNKGIELINASQTRVRIYSELFNGVRPLLDSEA